MRLVQALEGLNPGACVIPIVSNLVDPGELMMTGDFVCVRQAMC